MRSTHPVVALVGGTGGGKTQTGPMFLLSRHATDKHRESISLTVSPTYKLARKTTIPKIEKIWSSFATASNGLCEYNWDKSAGEFSLRWRDKRVWKLYMGTADEPSTYEGVHVTAGAWGDELGQDSVGVLAWETLKRRVAMHAAQILLTTTPYNSGWLKDVCEEKSGRVEYIKFKSSDNPLYSAESLADARASMPPWRYKMIHEGEFSNSPLLVYPTFGDCVTDELPTEYDTVIAGLDWGSTNATAYYRVGLRGDTAHVSGEIYESGKSSDEKYSAIAADCRAHKVNSLYIDPSAAQVIIDLQARGVPATAADNSVRDGIHRVQNLIEAGRLRVSSACYNLIDEGKRYKWRTDRKENVIEVPVKIADHGMDAIRYPLYTYGEWRSAAAKVPTMEKSEAMWERRF